MAHWEAIARFTDGTEIRFNKPYTADGNYETECEQQYAIECRLLEKAVDTGKDVEFYSVDFVED